MVLVTNNYLLKKAQKRKYAVGAFNINNLEFLHAVTSAAKKLNSPVIIQATPFAIKYAGIDDLVAVVKATAKNSNVPMSLHLDHGKDLGIIKKCIKKGFTSVMYDGSHLPYSKNLKNTKKAVNIANKEASVEAELGRLSGVEDEVSQDKIVYTDPQQAKEFVEHTGVDALAVAIGTSHGAYKFRGEQKLKIDILKKIKEVVDIPLVLHGASGVPISLVKRAERYGAVLKGAKGVPDSQIKQAIKNGISKINIDTDERLAFTTGIREFLKKNPEVFDPRKILTSATNEIEQVVKQKIKLFGSIGRI